MSQEKKHVGRPEKPENEVKNIRFEFKFSKEEVERFGGKEKIYEFIRNTVSSYGKENKETRNYINSH